MVDRLGTGDYERDDDEIGGICDRRKGIGRQYGQASDA